MTIMRIRPVKPTFLFLGLACLLFLGRAIADEGGGTGDPKPACQGPCTYYQGWGPLPVGQTIGLLCPPSAPYIDQIVYHNKFLCSETPPKSYWLCPRSDVYPPGCRQYLNDNCPEDSCVH